VLLEVQQREGGRDAFRGILRGVTAVPGFGRPTVFEVCSSEAEDWE
jgi:hypothetical protein